MKKVTKEEAEKIADEVVWWHGFFHSKGGVWRSDLNGRMNFLLGKVNEKFGRNADLSIVQPILLKEFLIRILTGHEVGDVLDVVSKLPTSTVVTFEANQ